LSPRDPNIESVQAVAKALGPLAKELVFVGGSATGLLITDRARPPVRPTLDVDVVAEVTSRAEYYALAGRLRAAGFVEDRGSVICRWRLSSLVVDVMPTQEEILGFTNLWYLEAMRTATDYELTNGIVIKLITAPVLVATKIEAFYGRGDGDYGRSHDIEDIVTLVDGRPELVREIAEGDVPLRRYLREEVDDLLADSSFVDTIPWHLPPDEANQARVAIVIDRLRAIAGM
jgi:predicted nucleotidyltransferase